MLSATRLLAVALLPAGLASAQDCLPPQPLVPPGFTIPLDDFGSAVAVKDGVVLVGLRYDDNGGVTNAGSTQVFDATSGAFLGQLFPTSAVTSAEGGTSVDLDGGLAVMGSPYITTDDNSLGTAWIHDVATGAVVAELQPGSPGLADRFGADVAISGDTVVVGAPEDTPGAVSVFDSATGALRFDWSADVPSPGDWVGWAVDVDGDVAITGALRDSQAGQPLAGAAYLFDVNTGAQLHRLEEPVPGSGAGFGREVAIDGDRCVVAGGGDVFLFDVPTGLLLRTFTSPGATGVGFGTSLALEGDRVVIGQPQDGSSTGEPGRVWVFDAVTGNIEFELRSPDTTLEDSFGRKVDLDGGRLVVSAPSTSLFTTLGRAYTFDLDSDGFVDLGSGLAGVAGTPALSGTGDLTPGGAFTVTLADAAPSAPLTIVLGLANLSAPLKGGVLVPSPDLILTGALTSPAGGIVLPSTWPAGGLGCVPLFAQIWIVDATGPAGLSASNGLALWGE